MVFVGHVGTRCFSGACGCSVPWCCSSCETHLQLQYVCLGWAMMSWSLNIQFEWFEYFWAIFEPFKSAVWGPSPFEVRLGNYVVDEGKCLIIARHQDEKNRTATDIRNQELIELNILNRVTIVTMATTVIILWLWGSYAGHIALIMHIWPPDE